MGRLEKVMRYSSRWQIGLAATLALIIVAAVSAVFALPTGAEDAKATLGENQQLMTVSYGTFITEVPVSGALVFPLREELTFDTLGVVGDVMVREGQQVNEGDVLAKLDGLTVAALGQAAARESVNVQSAKEGMDALLISQPVGIAQAEAAVAA